MYIYFYIIGIIGKNGYFHIHFLKWKIQLTEKNISFFHVLLLNFDWTIKVNLPRQKSIYI